MHKFQVGFTIIELMVTLVVLGVVLGIAIPSFNQQILNNSSLALGEEVVSAVNFARGEAVRRGRNVTICARADDGSCGSSNDWANGFVVFTDKAAETSNSPEIEEVLQVWSDVNPNAVIDVKRNGIGQFFIRYTGLGTAARLQHPITVMRVQTTGCTGEAAKNIVVSTAGAVTVSRAVCQ